MLFNSLEFVFVFLPIVFFGFLFFQKLKLYKLSLFWLTIASFYFYGFWEPRYILLIGASIIGNFFIAKLINFNIKYRKICLVIGLIGNLALLGYFKYTDFFITIINTSVSSNIPLQNIILPLAISFFTFQQIAYLIDVYKGIVEKHSFLNYCLFVTFMPQLLAGPIVHHSEMMHQFSGKNRLVYYDLVSKGAFIFCVGLFKKVVVADFFGVWSDIGFSDVGSLTSVQAWITSLAYTFQLYFDFSGYSDMAIGLALIFGVKLPNNFNSPYKSSSIIDFWKRWHITLSRFLRDYVYIPLGGNRKGNSQKYFNMLITMVLGGFWHGASYTFLIWGLLHGVYLLINHAWRHVLNSNNRFKGKEFYRLKKIFYHILTFLSVVLAWIFFRADNIGDAFEIIRKLFFNSPVWDFSISFIDMENYFKNDQVSFAKFLFIDPGGQVVCLFFLLVAYLSVVLLKNSNQLAEEFTPTITKALFVAAILIGLFFLNVYMATSNEFIYYRF